MACDGRNPSFVNSAEFSKLALTGPLTPDHVIRTKGVAAGDHRPGFRQPEEQLAEGVTGLSPKIRRVLRPHDRRQEGRAHSFDDFPRIVLIPGVGLLA